MTDPTGIMERGAEQSAPRSRWERSASDANRVAGSRSHLVTSNGIEKTVVALHRQPPDTGLDVDRRATVSQRRTQDLAPVRPGRAVERRAHPYDGARAGLGRIGGIRAELRAKRGRSATRAIACLTSSSGDRHARHVAVEASAVVDGAAIRACQRASVMVERVAGASKSGVE